MTANQSTIMCLQWTKLLNKTVLLIRENTAPIHTRLFLQNDPHCFEGKSMENP